jgi:hypothetical protein
LDVTLQRINHGYNNEVNEKATLNYPREDEGFRSAFSSTLGMPFAKNPSGWAITRRSTVSSFREEEE